MLSSCGVGESAQLRDCEASLLDTLKSPASYKRVEVSEMKLDASEPKYYLVEIKYDAANSYNALLRDTYRCSYRLDKAGMPTTERFEPYGSDPLVDNLMVNDTSGLDATENTDDNIADDATLSDDDDRDEAVDAAEHQLDDPANEIENSGNAVEAASNAADESNAAEDY